LWILLVSILGAIKPRIGRLPVICKHFSNDGKIYVERQYEYEYKQFGWNEDKICINIILNYKNKEVCHNEVQRTGTRN